MEARKLKVELLMNGLSGKELAKILKVSPTTLYRKIKNPDTLTLQEIKGISKILELDSEKILDIFFN